MQKRIDYIQSLVCKGGPEAADYEALSTCFREIGDLIRAGVLSPADLQSAWPLFGDVFHSTNTMQGFVITKPHGYAGDFEIIERIYQHWVSPYPHLANWDHFFHAQQAPQAVRNRKRYFLDLMEKCRNSCPEDLRVLNVGSGPARDIYEYLRHGREHLLFECVDQDEKAIAYAKSLNRDFLHQVNFHQCNALRFNSPNQFNLVWSAGLFDYLSDRAFKVLVKRLLRLVRPQGQLVVGNFSPANSSRDYMEFGHWFLEHRCESTLTALAIACGVAPKSITIGREPEGVNLFLHIKKE